jgi:hypothetical protein
MKTFFIALLFTASVAYAQSEDFINLDRPMATACFFQGQTISKMVHMKESGMSLEEFQDTNPIPSDWSAEMKLDAAHAMANVWSLNSKEVRTWANQVMQHCLESKTNHGSAK